MHALLLVTLLLVSITEGCADQDSLRPKITRVLQHYRVQPPTSPRVETAASTTESESQGGDTSTAESVRIMPATGDIFEQISSFEKTGELNRASHVMQEWLNHQGEHPSRGLICIRLARLEFERVRYANAFTVLQACQEPETLADLGQWLRGEVLRGLDRPEESLPYFRSVADMRHSPLAPQAAFRVGDALYEAEKYSQARRQYRKTLSIYPEYPGERTVRYRLAMIDMSRGANRAATQILDTLSREAPASDPGMAAQTELTALEKRRGKTSRMNIDHELRWADTLRKQRRWPEALVAFERLAPVVRKRSQKRECFWGLAKTLESLQRYRESAKFLTKARRNGASGEDVVRMRIRLLKKMGKTERAIKLVKQRAGSSKKVKGLAAANTYMRQGKYEKAYRLYRRHFRKRRLSVEKRWILAWSAYRSERYREAARRFKHLRNSRQIRPYKAAYWHGRALMEGGKTDQALQVFSEIARLAPLEYYGIQAANRILDLGEDKIYLAASRGDFTPPSEALRAVGGNIRWLGANGTTLAKSPALERDVAAFEEAARDYGHLLSSLARARDRYRMGYDEDARLELRIARAAHRRSKRGSAKSLADRPSSLYVDNRALKRGLWGSSLRRRLGLRRAEKKKEQERLSALRKADSGLSRRLTELLVLVGDPYWTRRNAFSTDGRTLRSVPVTANKTLFQAAYPLVFESTLRAETEKYDMSPFLMSGIARVESAFNGKAVSSAGARGLLQVMPVTGRLIAQRRGDTEFSASELLLPERSLEYGTWYMNELLTKFRQQEPLAIIAYNAGPHRVADWLKARGAGTQMDEFIEEVPYRQARRYVKSVLRYISLYRRIYENRADLYVGQKLDVRFRDNINW